MGIDSDTGYIGGAVKGVVVVVVVVAAVTVERVVGVRAQLGAGSERWGTFRREK